MKKLLLTFLISVFTFTSLFALPGFTSYINDVSGEYVYYKDSTFSRESYVGILTYDQQTFQIRYYAPEDSVNKLEPKEVSLLLSINPEADHWEMTGERILTQGLYNTEDIDVINYLHDILYEFSARRIKAGDVGAAPVTSKEEYEQFGGNVTITYNSLVPLFNVETIVASDSVTALQCVTIGALQDSADSSFEDFKGIPVVTKEKKNTAKIKKAKAVEYSYLDHKLKLDEKWTQGMENLWLYENDAIISISEIPQYSEDALLNQLFITRKLMESRNSSYIDYENAVLDFSDSAKFVITTKTFQENPENPSEMQIIQNYKILTPNKEGGYDYFTLTAFLKAFNAKYKYFNNIISSYK